MLLAEIHGKTLLGRYFRQLEEVYGQARLPDQASRVVAAIQSRLVTIGVNVGATE